MNNGVAALAAVAALVLTAACGSGTRTTSVGPSELKGDALVSRTPFATPSFIGAWTSGALDERRIGAAASISLASCTNILLNITSQTATRATGTLSMSCPGGISASGPIVGQLGAAAIPLTWTGTAQSSLGPCAFSLSGTATPLASGLLRFEYRGTSCGGDIEGADDLRLQIVPPAPGPAPPPGAATDMIPFGSATILSSPLTIASWPITTRITLVDIASNGIHIDFSKNDGPDRWPDVIPPGFDGPIQWTLGMALNIGGRWYASAPIQFWNGLYRKGGPPSEYARNWFYDPVRWAPMTYHQPAPGEMIGLFACAGFCRNYIDGSVSPVKERSNVVLVPMPASDAGGVFTF